MSPICESCLLSMSHVSYLWVMSPIYESCLLSMSHVSYLMEILDHCQTLFISSLLFYFILFFYFYFILFSLKETWLLARPVVSCVFSAANSEVALCAYAKARSSHPVVHTPPLTIILALALILNKLVSHKYNSEVVTYVVSYSYISYLILVCITYNSEVASCAYAKGLRLNICSSNAKFYSKFFIFYFLSVLFLFYFLLRTVRWRHARMRRLKLWAAGRATRYLIVQ
jgi:hypothetical protein